MKILMVGCGAVGQVFGLYLQKAGVELGFYTRVESGRRLEQALKEGGLNLFQLSYFRRQDPTLHRLGDYQVVTDLAESKRFNPDQIWFATPSTVFYSTWFREFLREVPSKKVVCFAPEGRRSEFIVEKEHSDRYIFGGITFISWQRDQLEAEGRPDGVNFWLPPFAEIPLVGEENACNEVADLLKKGGIRAAVKSRDFLEMQAAVTGLMSAYVVGFELAGWSFGAFRQSPWLKLAALGAWEAAKSQLSEAGLIKRTLFRIITTRAVFYAVTLVLPSLTPFNLEKYLKFHYRKTREQTLNLMEVFAKDGKRQNLPVGNIQLLRQGLIDLG